MNNIISDDRAVDKMTESNGRDTTTNTELVEETTIEDDGNTKDTAILQLVEDSNQVIETMEISNFTEKESTETSQILTSTEETPEPPVLNENNGDLTTLSDYEESDPLEETRE